MMKVDDLFHVHVGLATTSLNIVDRPSKDTVAFLRPAASQSRTIAGWVAKATVPSSKIFPSHSLFVSTNGEGSHTYAYVSSFEFSCNSDVSVLIPKYNMSLYEKVFYARCITMNRFKFSYGRKPKGQRLKQLFLPDFPRELINVQMPDFKTLVSSILNKNEYHIGQDASYPSDHEPNLVRLDDIFLIENGNGLDLSKLEITTPGCGIRYVSRRSKNNGVAAYVSPIKGILPFAGNKLTCALSGEGGVLYTFLQNEDFYTSYHIACLTPIIPMSDDEMLFYAACIKANRFRYSFGRQANRTLPSLMVPSRSAVPSFVQGALRRTIDGMAS